MLLLYEKRIKKKIISLYQTIISWIVYHSEKWFWKDSIEPDIREVWSSDNNKVDEDGGPYYFDMNEIKRNK